MLRNRPLRYKLDRILSPTTLLPTDPYRKWPRLLMEYLSLVLGPILFEIYVNDMSNNLTIDHLLYAGDVKLIAPKKTIRCPPKLRAR